MVSPEADEETGVTWYVRENITGQGRQLWRFTDRAATNMGVINPKDGPATYFEAGSGETIWDCIRRQTPWFEPSGSERQFVAMNLGPGQYYPRMARPLALAVQPSLWSPNGSTDRSHIAGAQNQLNSLTRQLEAICRVVQPSPLTLNVYGHEIRNLLILAATEVEMHWRGILVANGLVRESYATTHYVKSADPLRLREYRVSFYPFPDIAATQPFLGWAPEKPTASLGWYAAYNGVKHNRENEFAKATLERVFEALAACVVMLVAQFGRTALTSDLSIFFEIEEPDWPLEEMYLSPEDGHHWTSISHPTLL
jgi:hypothetical protein